MLGLPGCPRSRTTRLVPSHRPSRPTGRRSRLRKYSSRSDTLYDIRPSVLLLVVTVHRQPATTPTRRYP
jgi:hypothetical protein